MIQLYGVKLGKRLLYW